jgi:hypothetical protein
MFSMSGLLMNEQERTWKEAIVDYRDTIPTFAGGSDENNKVTHSGQSVSQSRIEPNTQRTWV